MPHTILYYVTNPNYDVHTRLYFKKKDRKSIEKRKFNRTKISSFPKWLRMKLAREWIAAGSATSSWWKITLSKPDCFSFSTASRPLFSSLAVSTVMIPFKANCLTTSYPIPLFAPVTTAYLNIEYSVPRWNKSVWWVYLLIVMMLYYLWCFMRCGA